MSYETVILEKKGKIAIITLNRPEARNALNPAIERDLAAALREIHDDEEIEVLIITGAGTAFCAGVDLKHIGKMSVEAGRETVPMGHADSQTNMARLDSFRCPTIAAVNGPAITGGFELALACDMIIASDNAFFGDTHARVGIIPGGALSQRLPRLVGTKRAMEISLGCDFVSAGEAAQMGFINRVVPADRLLEAAEELANKIIGNHKESVLKYRQLIKEGYEGDLRTGLRLEVLENALWVTQVKPEDVEGRRLGILEKGRKQADDTQAR
jgi:enoyl-CoA hydratase